MLITDETHYAELLEEIPLASLIAVDTETNALPVYQGQELRGVSITIGDQDWYLSVSHPDSRNFPVQPLLDALTDCQAHLVMHNSPFDMLTLGKAGPVKFYPGRLYDTQVGDWLLDENVRSHRLKDVGSRVFGYNARAEQQALAAIRRGRKLDDIYRELRAGDDERWTGMGTAKAAKAEAKRLQALTKRDWATFTADDIWRYACQDTRLTYDLYDHQWSEIFAQEGEPVDVGPDVDREMLYQFPLAKMIHTGVKVDTEATLAAQAQHRARLAEINEQLGGVNLNSVPQLRHLLFRDWGLTTRNRTAGGDPSTDKETLNELEGEHPGVSLILEHRALAKIESAYLSALLDKQDADGRIHSSFNSARTKTGRLASSEPNLQTIPKESTNALVRSLFVPADGFELWEFDLSQAELRVAAGFANDVRLMTALEEGRDLHSEVAASIWYDNDIEGFLELLEGGDMLALHRRGVGKNINYSYQYGAQARRIAIYLVQGTGRAVTPADIAEAQRVIDGYEETFPDLARLKNGLANAAGQHGYVPLHKPGRFRRYRGPGYFDRKTYTALNSIAQGGVAEFLKDIHMEVDKEIDAYGRICLQVHDSLVMELDPGAGPVVGSLLQRIADDINPFRMRMLWDSKEWGKH